jgi:hypothetical protein
MASVTHNALGLFFSPGVGFSHRLGITHHAP